MINLVNSLRYDQHGRKRKTKAFTKAPKIKPTGFQTFELSSTPKRTTKTYKSATMTLGSHDAKSALESMKDRLIAQEESKKYTIAPAYNKGAYQVIPRQDVKHIGK